MILVAKKILNNNNCVVEYTPKDGFSSSGVHLAESDIHSIYVVLNGIPKWIEVKKFYNFVNQWGEDQFN